MQLSHQLTWVTSRNATHRTPRSPSLSLYSQQLFFCTNYPWELSLPLSASKSTFWPVLPRMPVLFLPTWTNSLPIQQQWADVLTTTTFLESPPSLSLSRLNIFLPYLPSGWRGMQESWHLISRDSLFRFLVLQPWIFHFHSFFLCEWVWCRVSMKYADILMPKYRLCTNS